MSFKQMHFLNLKHMFKTTLSIVDQMEKIRVLIFTDFTKISWNAVDQFKQINNLHKNQQLIKVINNTYIYFLKCITHSQ